jgi:YVTN family beta-propeller protein
MKFSGLHLRSFVCALLVLFGIVTSRTQSFINFEGKQTSPVRLSPDGTRLFAVNTPDNRLSIFDVSNPQNPILIAEIPVGTGFRECHQQRRGVGRE